ncbi:hypothetical protein HJG60_010517 [Phyllostomus discolor]|uniref:Uncharacterized protein n=1 Tax=Phyllostomus discolor TaxID=89673 RepID=A0A834ALC0_9CHIR|nr:hypothetical protein HJG60_010517 [Phyllostomus discolor]
MKCRSTFTFCLWIFNVPVPLVKATVLFPLNCSCSFVITIDHITLKFFSRFYSNQQVCKFPVTTVSQLLYLHTNVKSSVVSLVTIFFFNVFFLICLACLVFQVTFSIFLSISIKLFPGNSFIHSCIHTIFF